MEELLQKLFEADILNDESRKELSEALDKQLEEAKEAARADAAEEVEIKLVKKYAEDKEILVKALDEKISDFLDAELTELKEDIEAFRDLEAEYAEKVVENKAALSDEVQQDMAMLIDKLDEFMQIKITEEFEELKEDLIEARQRDLGRRIFEAVQAEFQAEFHNADDSAAKYSELESRLAESQEALEQTKTENAELARVIKMDEVLAHLPTHQREVMETVLQNVATEKLEEGYKRFLPRILREAKEESEKEDKDTVLSEGAEKVDESENQLDENVQLEVKTGDREADSVDDQTDGKQLDESYQRELKHFLTIAGINKDND